MLRKKYELDREFNIVIQLMGEMDDSIYIIDKILSDENLFKLIELDLSKRYQNTTKTGRKSTPVEVILRMIALKHLRGLSYEKTISSVKESLILRKFCRIYFNTLPDKSTLIRWSNQICQETLSRLNQCLTKIASDLQITKGKKIRTDGTVVCANIHFPSDNSLLVDGVKVISRLLLSAKDILFKYSINIHSSIFRNRYRAARRVSRQIDSLSKTRNKSGSQRRKQAYFKLIEITKLSFKQAQKTINLLKNINDSNAQKLLEKFEMFLIRIHTKLLSKIVFCHCDWSGAEGSNLTNSNYYNRTQLSIRKLLSKLLDEF